MASKMSQLALMEDATRGFEELLNNDLDGAKETFARYNDSCWHLVGAGISAFLCAALGMEDSELYTALDLLTKAEALATSQQNAAKSNDSASSCWPAGTEYKILVADSVITQALVLILTESYVEYVKALYRMNRAHKLYQSVFKLVASNDITPKQPIEDVFHTLNTAYMVRKANPAASSATRSSSFFSWGRKKEVAQPMRTSMSSTSLDRPEKQSILAPPASVPNSRPETPPTQALGSLSLANDSSSRSMLPAWQGDKTSTFIISGSAFGNGLFTLIFSLLPPKLRKLISWFGFTSSNRTVALNMLTVSAATGDDVHGYFAALALITFYCVVLLMCPWQNNEQYLLDQCDTVLSRITARFEHGTLWVLNQAKVCRMKRDTDAAIKIMEEALAREAKGITFREADSLLVFEASWCYMSQGQWMKAADSFKRMRELNSWSHATYAFMTAGNLLLIPSEERSTETNDRIKALFDELPSLCGLKRMLGEPPSTELFILRKIEHYKAKHARWVSKGWIASTTSYWDVMRLSPACELGLFWNTWGHAPKASIRSFMTSLASLTPAPKFATYENASPRTDEVVDLDNVDELAVRDLLLGALHRYCGEHAIAKQYLDAALNAPVVGDKWIYAFGSIESAANECHAADAETVNASREHKKAVWKRAASKAEAILEKVFTLGEFDLKSRIESRSQIFRDEIAARKAELGIH